MPRFPLCRIAFVYALLTAGAAPAAEYPLPAPGEDLVGEPSWAPVLAGDNLATIAYRHGLGFRHLIKANPGMDPWALDPRKPVLLPTAMLLPRSPRRGIVVNVPEMRLYYYPPNENRVHVYPVAVGRVDWKTPLGATMVRAKTRDPVWRPPESIRAEHAAQGDPLPPVVPPGPENPLGRFAMRLGWPDILIHGTNMPLGGIGMPVTHGCLRLYPDDIEALFERVPLGTPVVFIEEHHKLGRHQGQWQLEAHAPLRANPHESTAAAEVAPALVRLRLAAGGSSEIDWARVEAALRQSTGVPAPVAAPGATAVRVTAPARVPRRAFGGGPR